ncbi:hypothetical protein GCM10009617_02670 [Leifsonia poae]|uniref:Large exoprotein n=2 Tax=Leifsonia poae TaxID=110933 RepID=A0A9W6H782_9MICO|nr:hypothetical protein GCM10017584_02670 [Leifsonia poae]
MGGGVVVAIAAALWLAYLIPVWARRREYLATERNAVRLQQTLRILAETSELPDEVRMEATARTVAEQQRILKRSEQKTLAEARATAAAHARREQLIAEEERLAAEEAERAARAAIALERASRAAAAERARALATVTGAPVVSPLRRRRLRRARALTSGVLVLSVVGLVAGVTALVTAGAWPLFATSAVLALGSLGMLGRLARPQTVEQAARPRVAAPTAQSLYDHAELDAAQPQVQRRRQETWTPQPLPKPLHLSRGTIAASAMASIDAATELRRSAARAEIDRRVAELAPEATPLRPAVSAPNVAPNIPSAPVAPERPSMPIATAPGVTVPSRYASMGLVDGLGDGTMDLDAVLRRRRAAS